MLGSSTSQRLELPTLLQSHVAKLPISFLPKLQPSYSGDVCMTGIPSFPEIRTGQTDSSGLFVGVSAELAL